MKNTAIIYIILFLSLILLWIPGCPSAVDIREIPGIDTSLTFYIVNVQTERILSVDFSMEESEYILNLSKPIFSPVLPAFDQHWFIEKDKNSYRLYTPGKKIFANVKENGTTIGTGTGDDPGSVWNFVASDEPGYFIIVSADDGRAIDSMNENPDTGSYPGLGAISGSPGQLWRLEPILNREEMTRLLEYSLLLDHINRLRDAGEPDKAMGVITTLLADCETQYGLVNPKGVMFKLEKIRCMLVNEQFTEAESGLKELVDLIDEAGIELQPDDYSLIYNSYGNVLLLLNKKEQAKKIFQKSALLADQMINRYKKMITDMADQNITLVDLTRREKAYALMGLAEITGKEGSMAETDLTYSEAMGTLRGEGFFRTFYHDMAILIRQYKDFLIHNGMEARAMKLDKDFKKIERE